MLFNAEDFGQLSSDFAGLFGLAGLPLVGEETLYRLLSFAPLYLVGFLGCGPWVRDLCRKLGTKKAAPWLEAVVMALLLVVCTAYLVDGSFSPFLYFRF